MKMSQFDLTAEEKKELLKISRTTLETYLKTGQKPQWKAATLNLQEKRGAFVTLKKFSELRGCIGRIVADTPLYQVIADTAIDSAVNDPRFEPVSYNELKDLEIEISVLTPFEKVKQINEIEVGKHGLLIRKGYHSGLLLPQVPSEYGWRRQEFLEHTCLKAGLDKNDYLDPEATLYKFSAIVFNESDF
jgi:AmmeMemoRadiSam system protein A